MPPKTALVVYNPKRRVTIYKIRHYKTKRDIYVGQTCNQVKRRAAYRASVKKELGKNAQVHNLIVAYVHRCQDKGVAVDLEPLDKFPDGVPADRSDAFEALMIHDLGTASACGKGGKNTSCGNNLGIHEPLFERYRKEIEDSGDVYVWSDADVAMRDAVASEVVVAQAQLAALQAVQEMVHEASDKPTPNLDEQVKWALVDLDDAVRKFMGPLLLAEALADKYEAQLDVLAVDAAEFKVDLNALRDKLNEQPVPDEDLLGLCRAVELMAKREVTAGFVAHQFRALAQAIQVIEEAKLPECTGVKIAKEIRQVLATTKQDWLQSPKHRNALPQEKGCYHRLATWKEAVSKKHDDDLPSHVAAMRFILRSNPASAQRFGAYFLLDKRAKADATTKQINAMLLDGYAHPNEPEFEGRKQWPAHGLDGSDAARLYKSLKCFYNKSQEYTQARRDAYLEGLKAKWPEREVWWWNMPGLAFQRKAGTQPVESDED